jgi:Ca2+-binding EF-hand superfamily protein
MSAINPSRASRTCDPISSDTPPDAVAELRRAMAEQPADALARTLAQAAKETPKVYRTALRDELEGHLADSSRLERHLRMLDENADGKVSPSENYRSLRGLRFGPAKALAVAGASQLALVLLTRDDLGLSIPVKNANRGQHKAVHTGAFDPEQALAKKLDEMMEQDLNGDGALTMDEVARLIDKRTAQSGAGAITKRLVAAVNKAEFSALFELMGGKMTREDLRDFYTGSLFFSLLTPDALAKRLVELRGG